VLLRANSDAFSTTRSDLFRDLFPFIGTTNRTALDKKISRALGYDVSDCVVSEQQPEGTSYKCNIDYSVGFVFVLIDHDGHVIPE
jgi:hypothetical protein